MSLFISMFMAAIKVEPKAAIFMRNLVDTMQKARSTHFFTWSYLSSWDFFPLTFHAFLHLLVHCVKSYENCKELWEKNCLDFSRPATPLLVFVSHKFIWIVNQAHLVCVYGCRYGRAKLDLWENCHDATVKTQSQPALLQELFWFTRFRQIWNRFEIRWRFWKMCGKEGGRSVGGRVRASLSVQDKKAGLGGALMQPVQYKTFQIPKWKI